MTPNSSRAKETHHSAWNGKQQVDHCGSETILTPVSQPARSEVKLSFKNIPFQVFNVHKAWIPNLASRTKLPTQDQSPPACFSLGLRLPPPFLQSTPHSGCYSDGQDEDRSPHRAGGHTSHSHCLPTSAISQKSPLPLTPFHFPKTKCPSYH